MRVGAAWCSLCQHPVQAAAAPVSGRPGWQPPASSVAAAPTPQWSRWSGGTTSFGPLGRVLVTVVYLLFGVGLFIANPLGLAVWAVALPVLLRSTWKKVRTDLR